MAGPKKRARWRRFQPGPQERRVAAGAWRRSAQVDKVCEQGRACDH
jgi:hypothetical protein